MDRHWIEACQREGRRVGVVTGGIAAEVNPHENAPMVVPAVVVGPAEKPGVWWLGVEFLPGHEKLPQMYPEKEILGIWPA